MWLHSLLAVDCFRVCSGPGTSAVGDHHDELHCNFECPRSRVARVLRSVSGC